jgi:uncharacterized membrane protein HdeD (DUF308 family)
MDEFAQVGKGARIWGWITLLMGLLAVASPVVSGVTVVIMVAIVLIVAGVARVIAGLQGDGFWSLLFGVIYVVGGAVMLGRPYLGLASLTMVLIIYFLANGIGEIIAAFQVKPAQGWGFVLFSGIVSVILAFMIWNQWPLSGAWAIGVLVGIQLIFAGLTMITVGSAIKQSTSQ